MGQSDIAVIGLAVMGENLIMNMESKGFTVTAYGRREAQVKAFVEGRAKGKNIIGTSDLKTLVESLKTPRKVMLMIKAGKPVDDVIGQLVPLLEKGDIIIDGGNSHYPDTERRRHEVESHGLLYVGTGVSGGEEGALLGPLVMPGGSPEAWPHVKPVLQGIAARTSDGSICCDWVGEGGAGHFVKMVHNGIEYGDIQLITETYHLMKDVLGFDHDHMADVFSTWNKGPLDSYLIEITSDILGYKDTDGSPLVTRILDAAGQKGTGKWTAVTSLDEGVPLTLITESVYARFLSSMKDERVTASKAYTKPSLPFDGNKDAFLEDLQKALHAAKIMSYAQGFALMGAAAKTYGWMLDFGKIALLWREGCIIRSAFLETIKAAYDKNPDLENLLLDDAFKTIINDALPGFRRVVAKAVMHGIPVPSLSSALTYFDGYTTGSLPANLLQAMRDYFGAHTYERTDRPRGEFFHTDWTGRGGKTSSTTYNV